MRKFFPLALVVALAAACASLGPLGAYVQAPRFERVPDDRPSIRLAPPSLGRVLGGATIRIVTRVTNPNAFGFTLSSLDGTLYLDNTRAATSNFPLGLPLGPGAQTDIPIELSVDFAELPGLANVIRSATARQPIDYRFEGTVGVDAGRLGTPRFGPMTFVSGTFN